MKVQTSAIYPYFPELPLDYIEPSPTNPRTHLTEASIAEMAASIRVHGVTQPILTRPHPTKPDMFEIVYGERRYRGSLAAGIRTIPAFVRQLSDREVAELQLIENLQREGVHELDEAKGYHRLMRDHGLTAEAVAERIGKSKKYVYDRLKLLELIPELHEAFYAGRFSAGHAILLARLSEERQAEIVENRLAERMSVRELGVLLQKKPLQNRNSSPAAGAPPRSFRQAAEDILRAAAMGDADARQALAAIMSEMGRRGGRRTKETTTYKQRQAWALKANEIRWKGNRR